MLSLFKLVCKVKLGDKSILRYLIKFNEVSDLMWYKVRTRDFSASFKRAGALRQHDPCVLQRGGRGPRRLRHDQTVHVSGRPQVERRPGLKGNMMKEGRKDMSGMERGKE